MRRPFLLLVLAALVTSLFQLPSVAAEEPRFSALVFSKTNGFRHEAIPYGVAAIEKLGEENNFAVTVTEDAAVFTDESLAAYDVVIFNSTNSRNGQILNADQRAAFERYIQAGGGYTGIHSASGTEYDWPWYGELMGAFFLSHPAIQDVEIEVDDAVHPSTAELPQEWLRNEEPYDFQTNPRGKVHVLASFDAASYDGDRMGADHPISWCQNFDGGRSWYTGLGHNPSAFSEPLFLEHIHGGIEWAAGVVEGDCGATDEERFEKIQLDGNTDDPLDISIADDGKVFYVQRGGAVRYYDPADQNTHEIGKLDVFVQHTHGVHGITLDPNFGENNWLYIYYSPTGDDVSVISRFTFDRANDVLDVSSEKRLLEINSQRAVNAHEGGGMDFDTEGNLYIATGDNSLPCCSGFGATDERPGHAYEDAQGSSANTNDLRGKILRIHPEADGSYTVPEGNLFAPGTEKTRPEIFVMGLRNPYRIHIDPATNWLYWGEVGPDARQDSATRGPKGYDEFNVAREAGNFGWPHCIADNQAYLDYDYATGASGEPYDCAGGPVNDSPNNTGLTQLPPAQPASIYYPYDTSPEFPELGSGGRLAVQGPTYHFDPALESDTKWPEYYDGSHLIAEWTRNAMFEVKPDADDNPAIINPLLPNGEFLRPIDMEFGPDGSLYLVEWGSNYGGSGRGDPNTDSGIYKINYATPGKRSPIATATATPTSGQPPLTVTFSSEGTSDPDEGDTLTYAWDFDGDGTTDSADPNPTHEYTVRGDYTARLTVTDETGRTGVVNLPIVVGNSAPDVEMIAPLDGQVFDFGDPIPFDVAVEDPEDGSSAAGGIDCTRVVTQPALGHDQHGHPLEQYTGCDGMIRSIVDGGHDANDNIFYIVDTKYTDLGGDGVSELTRGDSAVLQPRHKQIEHYTSQEGIQLYDTEEPDGGRMIGQIDHGDHVSYEPVNLRGISELTFRVASGGTGGTIEIRTDAPDGPLVGSVEVAPTGGWRTFETVTAQVEDPGGSHELFLVFTQEPGASSLFNLDWVQFANPVTDPIGEAWHAVEDLTAAIEAHPDALDADQHERLTGLAANLDATLLSAWFGDAASVEFEQAVDKALNDAATGRRWVDQQRAAGELEADVAEALGAPLDAVVEATSATLVLLRDVTVATSAENAEPVVGDTVRVGTTVTNEGSKPLLDARPTLAVPDGWEIAAVGAAEAGIIPPGESFTAQWDVTVPSGAEPGEVTLAGETSYRHHGQSRVTVSTSLTLDVRPAAEATAVSVAPFVPSGGESSATVTVANNTDTAIDASVTLAVPAGWTAGSVAATIEANSSAEVDVALTARAGAPDPGVIVEDEITAEVTADGVVVAGAPTASTIRIPGPDDSTVVLDSGSDTSPVLTGYQRLSHTDLWDAEAGFGWTSTTQTFRDRGGPDDLRRDFTLSRDPGSLRLHIPAGEHTVSLLRGDHSFSSGAVQLAIGGEVVVPAGDNLAKGTYAWEQFTLDGGAEGRTIDLQVSNPAGDYWRLNALAIQ